MKKKKSKLSDKLIPMKEGITLPDANPLDEEIQFEREDRTLADTDAEYEGTMKTTEISSANEPVMSRESTAVMGSPKDDRTEASATSGEIDESTYRDATAGRGHEETERVSYGDVYEAEDSQIVKNESVGGLLKHVEQLRLAQDKINDLESELEELRRENDELLSAADTFKVLSEDYYEQLDKMKVEFLESRETSSQENRILKDSLMDREKLVNELKQANSDLKAKVETNFKQIRKRERDLEYRLEMAKVEETTLLKSKDKTILELRRKVDKLEQEMEAYREKNKEHYQKLQQQQQTVRGVVRALRIALTRLEGDFGVDFEVLKKAE